MFPHFRSPFIRYLAPEPPGGGGKLLGIDPSHELTEPVVVPMPVAGPMPAVDFPVRRDLVAPAAATVIGSPTRWTGTEEPAVFTNPRTLEPIREGDITDTYLNETLHMIADALDMKLELYFDGVINGGSARQLAQALKRQVFTKDGDIDLLIRHLEDCALVYGARYKIADLPEIYKHQLKNKLTKILGEIELAMIDATTPERARACKESLERQNKISVAGLILSISKIKQPVIVALKQAEGAGEPNFSFEFAIEFLDRATDPIELSRQQAFQLEIILDELLRNAEKYSYKKMALRFDVQERCFVVTNDGHVIPKGFDPFAAGQRADDVQHIEGKGFGLFSLKPTLDNNGWRITYTSVRGETAFRVWI